MSAIATPSPRLKRWLLGVAIAIATVAALILVAWLAVPPIVRSQLESRLTEALNRPTTVKEVAFDPFRLTVTLRNVAIGERTGPTSLLTIDELVADVSSATIIHRAPVLDALRIVHPVLSVSRDAKGEYSVQDLVDRALEGPGGPPPRFSVNNIEIDAGTLNFDDGVAQRKHTIDGLGMGIPFLSSLPYQTDIRVTPHVSGTFNGSHFGVEGSSVPFAERREATLDIDLDALPLAQYVAYLPSKPRYELARGALTTRLKVVFVDNKAGEQRLDVRGLAQIDDLAIRHRDGAPLIAAQRIAAKIDGIDVFGHEARVALLAMQGLSADVRRRPDGALELAQSWFDSAPARKADTQASPDKPWSVTVVKSTLAAGALTLVDEGSQFRTELADVTADVSNLSTKKGEKAHIALSFVSADRIASFKGEADVEPTVPTATGTFDLRKFSLPLLFPYYKDILNVEVHGGSADLAGSFALAADGNVKVTEGGGRIGDLRLVFPGAKEPLWRVPELVASGVEVDTSTRKVALGDVAVHSGALRIARERDGTLEAARLVKTTTTTGTSADTQTWTVAFKKLAFDRIALAIEDRVPQPPVKLAGREASLVVNDLSNARNAKATMTFRARIGPRGQLSFAGPLTTNPFSIGGQLDASGLDLVPLKPYVEPHVNVLLTSGVLAAKGRLALSVPDNASGPRATWNGNVSVTDFAALDRPTSSDLLRWKSLALDGVDVASEPFRVAIARIGAEDYYARLIVYQDGTVNLTRLLTPGAAPEPSTAATPEKLDKDAPVRASDEPLPITIGKIEVTRGNLNISDFFVRPNYSANLTDVTGTVSAMSKDQAGDIAIAARVDGTAPVEVKGRIQPFAKEIALDLAATARDVDLPPLTPYSIKYAGYGIEKGKLTFDVHYRIENRKLAADNRLVLDQLTFNRERVDSPTATKLPVLLAVALLKDSRGVIDLQLPISGTLDDPKFSMWGLIVQVIGNLIGKAATAPFALLTAAFGGHGEELSVVPFAAGSASLNDDAQKRMDTLAKALGDRPALKLEIAGRADLATDRDALRHNAVDTAMKREKMKSLVRNGNAPASLDLVTIGGDERSRWLKAAYEEAPIKSRPRNVIGMLKDVPDGEMEAMLLADAKVEDDAIRLLANARAETVKDALAAKGIAGERMFLLAPRLGSERGAASSAAVTPPQDAPPTRVDLALR